MKNEDFAHAVARVRVLETKLLNENEMERMLLAKSPQDAYKIFNELDYSTHIGDIDDVASFQEVINAGLKSTKELLVKIVPHKWVFDILWLRYDFHNIKTLLKAKLSGKEYDEIAGYLMPLGAIEIDRLKAFVFDGQDVSFRLKEDHEKAVVSGIKEAEKLFVKTQDPQMIDLYLDRKFCKISVDIAKASGHKFIIDFIRKYIDLKNIEAFIRLKIQGREESLLEQVLTNSGTLKKYRFTDAFKKDINEFSETMKHTDYADVVREGIRGFMEEKSFAPLEKATYDHLTNFIQVAKRIAFGPEPIIGYFWAKKNNALVIRTIMVGKLNGFEPDEIKSKLRTLYI
ncbi:MAG: V-type ATP synthase subunit C [Patescibacteria group bacterium]|nr:V-type ATP synthase subunit C [Patescibacteria group bacterium]